MNENTIRFLRENLPNHELMISIRHNDSVPESRNHFEGFKPIKFKDKDYERIHLLREAVQEQENGVQYFELEHEHRANFFLGGKNVPKIIVLYTNHKETPSLERLSAISSDIIRVGADHIVIETLIRDKKGDGGEEDRKTLLDFAERNLFVKNSRPLTIVGRGKYGGDLNLEAYKKGISTFAYGIVSSFHPIPLFGKKKAYQELPSLDRLRKEISLN